MTNKKKGWSRIRKGRREAKRGNLDEVVKYKPDSVEEYRKIRHARLEQAEKFDPKKALENSEDE